MSLDTEQLARLLSAGSVAIPCFPEPGHISAERDAFRVQGRSQSETTLQVVHYPSPAHKNLIVIPLSEVTAIYLPDGLTPGTGPAWLIGEEIRSGAVSLDQLAGGSRPGTVFVREAAGVLMRTESAKTAAEVASLPGNCL